MYLSSVTMGGNSICKIGMLLRRLIYNNELLSVIENLNDGIVSEG